MPASRATAKAVTPAKLTKAAARKAKDAVLLRYRDNDTAFGVTRETAAKLVRHLGLSETQVIHVALAQFAAQTLPRYEKDDGPLTDKQMAEIERLQPSGRMKLNASL